MAIFVINRGTALREGIKERVTIDVLNRGESSFKADLQEVWEGVQADRAEMLAQVRELQLAAQLLMQAEGQRLAAQAADDHRLPALVMGLKLVGERITTLDEEISVATVRVPMVKKTEALLNGRITDDQSRPAGPVRVTLADENGAPVPGVPEVEVDSGGYYAIVVPAEAAAHIPPDRRLTISISNGAERVPAGGAPITLGAGSVKVRDVLLDTASLERLKLRSRVAAPRAEPAGPAARKRAAPGRAKSGTPRK